MDRISGLPDVILCHTLSFLSTNEAALTSLLSKRWRNLFAFTPNLRFEDQDKDFVSGDLDLAISRSFSDFVDRVLAVSGNFPIKKFSLKYRHNVESAHINLWICNVLSRGVLDHLHIDVIAKGSTSLPLAVFTCKTIVKLKLRRGFVILVVPENASLPALKGRPFETLLSACNVLEELLIRGECWEHYKWCCTVSCPTLQRLTINVKDCIGFLGTDFRSITFNTPSLTYLDYEAYVPDEYRIVNLDSLVEAKLTLTWRMFTNKSNPTNLIKGLRNVEILNLLTFETCEGPSSHYYRDYGGHECVSGYSFLSSCPVKVLEITEFWGTIGEFGQMKRLLEKLPCLELLKVSAWGKYEKVKLQLATDMLMLPRACKIQLKFFSCKTK